MNYILYMAIGYGISVISLIVLCLFLKSEIKRLHKEKNDLMKVFQTLEMPLIPVLIDMEFAGISVDGKFFKIYADELNQRILAIQKEVYTLVD